MMKSGYLLKLFLVGFAVILLVPTVESQITVNNSAPYNKPYWLAENVLVDTNFFILPPYDPPFSGIVKNQPSSIQVGFFDASSTTFPLDSGIVMSTSAIDDILPLVTGINPKLPAQDRDLVKVLKQIGSTDTVLNDLASIEFSFIATSDSIQFNYVFGSHEYANYTCSQFNDVFGFFLTGNSINGNSGSSTVNLATIPGTSVPVAINTINQGFPSGGYSATTCSNANPSFVAHSQFYNASNGTLTSLSGYTDVFTAKAQVQCGGFYQIKLVIADVFDDILNSAVFLEANSFRPSIVNLGSATNTKNSFSDSLLVEGCSETAIILEKTGSLKGKNVAFKINKLGTAIDGIDYSALPDSFYMPAGTPRDSIFIQPIDDGIAEPNENVLLSITQIELGCALPQNVVLELFIRDKVPLSCTVSLATASDTLDCPGDTARINGSFSGGDGNTFGRWLDDTAATLSRLVAPFQTTTYYFEASDECASQAAIDSFTVFVKPYTPVTLQSQSIEFCEGDELLLSPIASGGRPPLKVSWQGGTTGDSLSATPIKDSLWIGYSITDACKIATSDSIFLYFKPGPEKGFEYGFDVSNPLSIGFSHEGSRVTSYRWEFGDGDSSTEQNPTHFYSLPGEYEVLLTLITDEGCEVVVTQTISVEDLFRLYIPDAFTPNNDGVNDEFLVGGLGFASFEMRILNRWGEIVFVSDDPSKGWDGTAKDQPAPVGHYFFQVIIESTLGKYYREQGTFSLFR